MTNSNRKLNLSIEKDTGDKVIALSMLINHLIIPIFLAGIAIYGNNAIQNAQTNNHRLNLSIDILSSEPNGSIEDRKLRQWAFDVASNGLNLDFSNEMRTYLEENRISDFRLKLADDLKSVFQRPVDEYKDQK